MEKTQQAVRPIYYADGSCYMLDQRLLPVEERWHAYRDYREIAEAIKTMVVRGAPAIGVAAAYGAAFAAAELAQQAPADFEERFAASCTELGATRPTAVNLFWALERMQRCAARMDSKATPAQIATRLLEEAQSIAREDEAINRALGAHGQRLLPQRATVLTHCNAGALATAGYGTALGVIRAAVAAGKKIDVIADETRPFLQGARLTAWELQHDHIPVTLICDNMAGYMLQQGRIDAIIVGADRVAANGDTANKIGTYPLAVLAQAHKVPFYIAAPVSTIDYTIPDGTHIPIEERDSAEVTTCGGQRIAPEGIQVYNPSFDVTPAHLISAIITEHGVVGGDYLQELAPFKEG
ncbi:MAG: S-methyl-5-thioribose-1-phosphate isomerase [Desulfuromonadaceae bacterium]|nr:S-methyl-5-thioribose-1-phosphate isomerase [Geobacteraceae bacterium]